MQRYAFFAVGIAATLWIAITARGVLQPLLISVLIWFLLSATARLFARVVRGRDAAPGFAERLAATAAFAVGLAIVASMLSDSARDLARNLPAYTERLSAMLADVVASLGLDDEPPAAAAANGFRIGDHVLGLAGSLAAMLGSIVIILCYVVFIFAEADAFERKLAAIVPEADRRARVSGLISEVRAKVEVYIAMMSLVGLAQAVPTYIVLSLVGLDSPMVWSVLIFLLSFIPTLGTMIGIALPSLLALAQFDTLTPFLIVIGVLAPVQLLASNLLAPRLMGSSLNLSPLAVFIAIFAGGALWGIVGALISVPALNIAAIVCAQFQTTRPVAILLSSDGDIRPGA